MEKLPPVTKELLDYLHKAFPNSLGRVGISDRPHVIAAHAHKTQGQQMVIEHLTYVLQQLEEQEG